MEGMPRRADGRRILGAELKREQVGRVAVAVRGTELRRTCVGSRRLAVGDTAFGFVASMLYRWHEPEWALMWHAVRCTPHATTAR